MNQIYVLHLQKCPIFEQLQLEEALLRADQRNWCILNEGTPPAIVMGISGKIEQMINQSLLEQDPIPVIRRFSGGGTVVVDENTVFSTLILNKEDVKIACCPQKILYWTGEIYRPMLQDFDFNIRENDYALGDRKFGGNAQYMRQGRWLHHSSLLWDYDPKKMNYLLFPPRTPIYREKRGHEEFLCKLSNHLTHKHEIAQKLLTQLHTKFEVIPVMPEDAMQVLERPHRKSTLML